MSSTHILGFPRIGAQRELKRAVEAYWKGDSDAAALEKTASELRERHWRLQQQAGLSFVSVGDFAFYDHVLDHSAMFACVPPRFGPVGETVDLDTYFRMARGRAPSGETADACEMTKWFDTNYHYIVPEFQADQAFRLASEKLFNEVAQAQALDLPVKATLLGPLSYLWLGKCKGGEFDKLALLDALLPVYGQIIERLGEQGVAWVQIDEPILALDLPPAWAQAFESVYNRLQTRSTKLLLATYFDGLDKNLVMACALPVAGLHIDAVRAPKQVSKVLDNLPAYKVLSVGLIDGRNIWKSDLSAALKVLEPLKQRLGDRLWLAPSCSLLHVPVDLDLETELDAELKSWLAFAAQKLGELQVLQCALDEGLDAAGPALADNRAALDARRHSKRIHRADVKQRLEAVSEDMLRRKSVYSVRAEKQRERLHLPLYPTTTIGSFPQTGEIRSARHAFKQGTIDEAQYTTRMRAAVAEAVSKQEDYGLDVLVHGEPERNDMVEYFGELLEGFAFTRNGWVQSYGSRCVKPPVIFGDVSREQAMTVQWTQYAQSLTQKPMKGMLTGPVTILQWSFVRDDQARATTCEQIALALRDEVQDLERAGIAVIQIDEPALREGLPLKRGQWDAYLAWAVESFRLATTGVEDATQIHTHMCYSEFNDIIQAIAELDADVITIETARSDMELLDAFESFEYPNEIGPGVYDIHSPNLPTVERMVDLLQKAGKRIAADRLWVNPDCGLKTRGWPEVDEALRRMVTAAKVLRTGARSAA